MGNFKVYGNGIKVIGGGVELEDSKIPLNQADNDSYNISPDHSFTDKENGEIDENLADAPVLGSYRFKDTNHCRPFKD